jgi:hypothetical protein
MAITLTVTLADITQGLLWSSLSITESIGQPDELSCEVIEIDATVRATLIYANTASVLVDRDGDILFSGLLTSFVRTYRKGVISYNLRASGWDCLFPKTLVGVPSGYVFATLDDGTQTPVDHNAEGIPATAAGVQGLFTVYWKGPAIDTATYVTDILPSGVTPPEYTFSGSDLEGCLSDLAAAGSAAAAWWIASDSPNAGDPEAPHLALHWGIVATPEEADYAGDDLLLGLPSSDAPAGVGIAPYSLDCNAPDWVASILPLSLSVEADYTSKIKSVYVRGGTGSTMEGTVHRMGGTGWVGTPGGGDWGAAYVDAPGAVTSSDCQAFGGAYLALHGGNEVRATANVTAYHGWHRGQMLAIHDDDLGWAGVTLMIRSVAISTHDPAGEALEYALTLGTSMAREIGYALRTQRLEDQRKPVDPAVKFIPYVGDLALDPGDSCPVTMQLATASGKAVNLAGIGAHWHLLVNGVELADPTLATELFYLTDTTVLTDEIGQVTATLNASATATTADAANPWAEMTV